MAVCLVLSLLAFATVVSRCHADLQAGAAVADITPEYGVSLDGPISKNGPVNDVHDRLHARAIVISDGTSKVAIVICDACMISDEVFNEAKQLVNDAVDLPIDRMLMAATHTHAAVRAIHVAREPADDEYHRELSKQISKAVIEADQNLAPAQIGFASFERPDYVKCRRFLCEPGSVGYNPFGELGERIKSVAGTSKRVIEPAGPVDPQFSVVSIQHLDGTPLAVLGNFSVHYCGGYRRGTVSADYFGHYCAALGASLNPDAESTSNEHPPFVAAMSNGTSGNTSSIDRQGKSYQPFEWMQVSARALADDTLSTLESIEYQTDISIEMTQSEIGLGIRRPDEARIQWAEEILSKTDQTHPHQWTRIYAQEALHLRDYPRSKRFILQAIRIGDIAIAGIPCEVFAETGLTIKSESPFANTFTIELANGYGGYLPSAEQHELGGYETWPARSSFLEVGAEGLIRNEVDNLLKQLEASR